MPVASQDAVLDGATGERKPHVRTPVVDGVDLAFVVKERDRPAVTADDRSTLGFEIRQRCDPYILRVFDRHTCELVTRTQNGSLNSVLVTKITFRGSSSETDLVT